YGAALWRPLLGLCRPGRNGHSGRARPPPYRLRDVRRHRRFLGPGAGAPRRFEVVRIGAFLHIPESSTRSAGRVEPLRPMEHRREERGQLRGNRIPEGGLMRRRTFLKSAPAAAMAAGAAGASAGDGIRLGFDSYSIRNFHWKALKLVDYAGSHKL